jgi:hypothetical protein
MTTFPLFEQARARFDHESARKILKEKYEAKMLFAYRQGMWRAGPDLLVLLSACTDAQPVILDLYSVPVQIDRDELRQLVNSRWQEQMTAWLVEYNDLQNQR